MEGENVMNTACERINFALERIVKVGWQPYRLRKQFDDPAGPGCLLGSLVTDAEYATAQAAGTNETSIYGLGLPGLREAATAMEFEDGKHVWGWNDAQPDVAPVLERLAAGKKRACA